ncbi:ROK family protein [Vibrio sp. S4M6]|uniref:ROK family protein n=1 Tax=Vibrio sinus TaxID=2946865 RepID=UPI00202A8668|nr:ROK family protein [Vibrio sinus]MCL9780169.1 ROK family protein [Vibrio sinus]
MLIGFDIGGTKIEVCVLDDEGHELKKKRQPTQRNYRGFIEQIASLVAECEEEFGRIDKIGMGLPGAISPATGLVKNANSTFLNGNDLKHDLEVKLDRQVQIANDANCFALSEAVDGAGKEGQLVFGVIIGTGCGGGFVFDKQVIVGPNALCGEWGHNPLPSYQPDIDGPERDCYCGRKNCIETFISGTGFGVTGEQVYSQPVPTVEIMQQYREGNAKAKQAYSLLVDQMARCLASIVNILDPDVIVLGGGLSNVDELYQDLPQAMEKYVFSDSVRLNVRKAKYGDSSGIRGAAWLCS